MGARTRGEDGRREGFIEAPMGVVASDPIGERREGERADGYEINLLISLSFSPSRMRSAVRVIISHGDADMRIDLLSGPRPQITRHSLICRCQSLH